MPALARQLDPTVPQLHSAGYRNPTPAATRRPGAGRRRGNSGLQIAAELAERCPVTVAVGTRPTEMPQRIAGRSPTAAAPTSTPSCGLLSARMAADAARPASVSNLGREPVTPAVSPA